MHIKNLLLVFLDTRSSYSREGGSAYPPVGIAYVAGAALAAGHKVKVCDMRGKNNEGVYSIINESYDFVGFYCNNVNVTEVKKFNKHIKDKYPFVKTIAGGPQPSVNPRQFDDFDYVVSGEGEKAIVNILNETTDKYLAATPIEKLDELAFPAWNLFGEHYETIGIVTTRGCPYSCIYCCVHSIFGKKHRIRSVDNIFAEIKYMMKTHGTKHFEICDDNFTFNKNLLKSFCKRLISEKLGITWSCGQGARIDLIDEEIMHLIKDSGCNNLAVGIEAGNQQVNNNLKKSLDLKKAKDNIKLATGMGLRIKGFFLVGGPGETYDTVMESIQFFKDAGITVPRFGMLAPYPDTELYDWMNKNARVLERNAENYTHGPEQGRLCVPFDTPEFPEKLRRKAFKKATLEADLWHIKMKIGRTAAFIARCFAYLGLPPYKYKHLAMPKKLIVRLLKK